MSELYLMNRLEQLIDENAELVEELRMRSDYIGWLEADNEKLRERVRELEGKMK